MHPSSLSITHLKSPLYWRQYGFSFALLLLMAGLMFAPQVWQQALVYDAKLLEQGQWWRVFTGHIVHVSYNHGGLNLLAYALVVVILRDVLSPRRELLIVLSAMLGIGCALLFFNTDLRWYFGFSGVLHALMIAGALLMMPKQVLVGWGFFAFVGLKVWREQYFASGGDELAAFIGAPVAYDAHLYGACVGLLWGIGGIGFALRHKLNAKPTS